MSPGDTDPYAALRRLARHSLPYAVRWRIRECGRYVADRRVRRNFASARGSIEQFPNLACEYERSLTCYRGQERYFPAKRENVRRSLAACDGLVIAPRQVFSFWSCVGRPTERAGYRRAAALKDGRLTVDTGGAICLASTLLYNVGLLSGMEILERRCHSVDSYGAARYFELGRDATVEYAYIDLRMRNALSVPLLLTTATTENAVIARMRTAEAVKLQVSIVVSQPHACGPAGAFRVRTERAIESDGQRRVEDLGWSVHKSDRD